MLDVIRLIEELEENMGVKRFLGELTNGVSIDAVTNNLPAKVYLNKDEFLLNTNRIKRQKATDSKGKEYFVEYMNSPERDERWLEIRTVEIRYARSFEHISALVEIREDDEKTKISLGSTMKKQEYVETAGDKTKAKYTVYHGYDHSIGDEILQESRISIKKECESGHEFINISRASKSFRNRENTQDPNEPAQISSISAHVRVAKVSYVKGKQTEESTVYELGQTDEGKNVLIEIIHPIKGETEYKSYPLEDEMNTKGNEILQFLKEYNLIYEHTQEDYIKMTAKYAKAKEMLYDNQLIAIEEKEEQTIPSTDEETR